jgi:hypothetical protein
VVGTTFSGPQVMQESDSEAMVGKLEGRKEKNLTARMAKEKR